MPDAQSQPSPFEQLTALLLQATDAARSISDRRDACAALASVTTRDLSEMAGDPEWMAVRAALARDAAEHWTEGTEERESWGSPAPAHEAGITAPALPTEGWTLDLYTKDLRRLISDDFRDAPFVLDAPLISTMSPADRIAACAMARPQAPVATESFLRSLPWTAFNHGATAIAVSEGWPDESAIHERFWNECLSADPQLGTPYRLARRLQEQMGHSPSRRAWFNDVAGWVERTVEREAADFLPSLAMTDLHVALRVGIADWARRGEMTDAAFLATVDVWAMSHLLRVAAQWDMASAWTEGRGDARSATAAYRRLNNSGEMRFEEMLRALLAQPSAQAVGFWSHRERQAMVLVREIRRGSTLGAQGVLAYPDLDHATAAAS
jgi:hypothetical protein